MSKGKRYSGEETLNYKKVAAVVIAIIVFILAVVMIRTFISRAKDKTNKNSTTNYFSLYENNMWGVIDSKGEKIIEPMYQEMIVVANKNKDVFLCTYDVNEDDGTYKTKVVNKKNETIFTDYDKVEAIDNIDEGGNLWYEENVLKVMQNGKYGLIDLDGKVLLSPIYEQISSLKGIENSLIVKQDGLYGLVDNKGKLIINPKYKEIQSLDKKDYKCGYIVKSEDDKSGLIDVSGKVILENKYEKIDNIYGNNYYVIEEEGKQKVINQTGETLNINDFNKIMQISNSGIVFEKDNKYGVVNFEGEIIIKPIYDYLEEINTNVYKAKLNEKNGIIDLDESQKLPYEYTNIYFDKNVQVYIAENEDFTSSIINSNFEIKITGIISEINKEKKYIKVKVNDDYKYYNFNLEEKNVYDILKDNTLYMSKNNGKYGFIDKKGNVVVDYIYDDATEQNAYGYAAVKKDGLWGAIDSNGKVIIEPKYKLDNNLVIDFIGKWHLGEDLNMNYYCEK